MWNSDVNYKVFAQFGNNPEDLDNTIFINGSAHNVLLGYMLFSKFVKLVFELITIRVVVLE